MFKNFDWEDAFLLLLYSVIVSAVTIFLIWLCLPKYTTKYTLGTRSGVLTITKEIKSYPDDEITIDRSVSYWDAIRMVDSLNQTLKK